MQDRASRGERSELWKRLLQRFQSIDSTIARAHQHAARYDELARAFLAFVHLVATWVMIG